MMCIQGFSLRVDVHKPCRSSSINSHTLGLAENDEIAQTCGERAS